MSKSRHDPRNPRSTHLNGLGLENFKSVKSARIGIKPLTIVSGSNSAGKSTLLQAILALAQVSRRRIEGGRFPLNDELTRLGTLDGLRHQRSTPEEPVKLTFTFSSRLPDMRSAIEQNIGFSREEFQLEGFDLNDDDDIEDADIKWSVGIDSQFGDQTGSARVAAIEVEVNTGLLNIESEITRSDHCWEEGDYSANYDGFLHFSTNYGTNADSKYGDNESISITEATISSGQISSLSTASPDPNHDVIPHLEAAQKACAQHLANQVFYIGPLRHAPHLPFGSAPDPDSGSVGVSGEHVAAVFQAKRAASKQYPLPLNVQDAELTLEEAVNESLTVSEGTPLVYSIGLVPPGLDAAVPLSAVGVGVSQLLPVIVQCLVAGPGALVILEQPELHLHPAAQQRLADFLIACTNWGQRILVESHSEYLVLRLRRRIAKDDSDELRNQVAILFAEQDEQGDTTYRKVKMNEVGGVIDWPDGFFDQGQNEAHQLLVAAAERQRRTEEAVKP